MSKHNAQLFEFLAQHGWQWERDETIGNGPYKTVRAWFRKGVRTTPNRRTRQCRERSDRNGGVRALLLSQARRKVVVWGRDCGILRSELKKGGNLSPTLTRPFTTEA